MYIASCTYYSIRSLYETEISEVLERGFVHSLGIEFGIQETTVCKIDPTPPMPCGLAWIMFNPTTQEVAGVIHLANEPFSGGHR